MIEVLKTINIQVAGYIAIAMLGLTIAIHGLIMLKMIPYTWINGGRSVSYEIQKKQSITSSVGLLVLIPLILISSKIVNITVPVILINVLDIILWILVILFFINIIMQLLGTIFEKCAMSVIAFILLICILRIAVGI